MVLGPRRDRTDAPRPVGVQQVQDAPGVHHAVLPRGEQRGAVVPVERQARDGAAAGLPGLGQVVAPHRPLPQEARAARHAGGQEAPLGGHRQGLGRGRQAFRRTRLPPRAWPAGAAGIVPDQEEVVVAPEGPRRAAARPAVADERGGARGPLLPCLLECFLLLGVRAIVEMDNGEEMTVRGQ